MMSLGTNLVVAVIALWGVGLGGSAHAQGWGCYDPKPSHPTAADKLAFIDLVSALAIRAEQKHGVPAAAIAAMAMVESGYGWTRTAIEAHNFFGWKFNSAAAAGGRPLYELKCQPPEDVNNRYIVFADAADAVDFVAAKLATLPAYGKKTAAYRMERAAGTSAQVASRTWIAAIADPYNWRPKEYAITVTRFMNDPISPSDQVSPDRNLYRLSPVAAAVPPLASVATAPDKYHITRDYFASRLTKRNCEPPRLDYPQWQGFPVQRCAYFDGGVKAETYMLNASADQLARWTVTACTDVGSKDLAACARVLSHSIIEASSGVFPVAGFIPEPAAAAGGKGGQILCLLFRDGVTVRTARIMGAPPAVDGKCATSDENEQAITRAMRFARVASTTRLDYQRNGGREPVGSDADGDPRWLQVVRTLYQRAWTSDRNELVSARAKSMLAEGKFN